MGGDFNSTIFQVGRTLVYLQLTSRQVLKCKMFCTKKSNAINSEFANAGADFLKHRKDALKIPKEFCMKEKINKGSYQEKLYQDPANMFLFANRNEWHIINKLNK